MMQYYSTRNKQTTVTAAEAITKGISPEGGLFVPTSLPNLGETMLTKLLSQSYQQRAITILSLFLSDFSTEEVTYCVTQAYTDTKFSTSQITKIKKPCDNTYLLELWHGPTCAFKDMALQILPYLLTVSAQKTAQGKKMVILVATSGDTGKAALDGFRDVPNTKVLVFYPEDGVSMMQKRQMITQEGENVAVAAISGNFDDAQTGVKRIFTNADTVQKLGAQQMIFSSANSINWGRLLPQIVYYISAYCDLVTSGEIAIGESIHVAVPTGNFGNILAAYYAQQMGIPIGKLICASNQNNVLTDFFRTGTYDRNRAFFATSSPSMDILVSSNLERLLYHLTGGDENKIATWYQELSQTGAFSVDESVKQKLDTGFFAGYCDQAETAQAIEQMFKKHQYLSDPHTAVAIKVVQDYRTQTGDQTKVLLVSTANPYKFSSSVLGALTANVPTDEYKQMDQLEAISGLPIPVALANLRQKSVRFNHTTTVDQMESFVLEQLGI